MSALEQFNCGNWTLRTVLVDGAPVVVVEPAAQVRGVPVAENAGDVSRNEPRGDASAGLLRNGGVAYVTIEVLDNLDGFIVRFGPQP